MKNQSSHIKQLSNKELLSHTKLLVKKERELHIQVLHHLSEIDSRKLFFKQGFSSLFDYAVRELGYSEGAAYRRIKAMKLCRSLPGTDVRLQSGSLSLSAASQLQVFFEKRDKKVKEEAKKKVCLSSLEKEEFKGKDISEEKILKRDINQKEEFLQKDNLLQITNRKEELLQKDNLSQITNQEKELLQTNRKEDFLQKSETSNNERLQGNSILPHFLSQEEKESLVKKVEGCSTRDVEKLLSEEEPSLSVARRERVRFLGKGKVEIKIVIEEKHYKELEELKALLSHRNPTLSYGELLSILSEEALKKHDPRKRNIRKKNVQQGKVQKEEQKIKSLLSTEVKGTSAPGPGCDIKQNTSVPMPRDNIKQNTSVLGSKCHIRKITSTPGPKNNIKKFNRAIPSYLRKYIWERDGGRCTYIHYETKRRCTSRYLLQIDHIQPFALNGKTVKENLRLLCAGHNQYRR